MFPSTRNSQEAPWPHTLVAGSVLVQIGALHNYDPNVIGMVCVPASYPGANLVNVACAPLSASPQIAAMETPAIVS